MTVTDEQLATYWGAMRELVEADHLSRGPAWLIQQAAEKAGIPHEAVRDLIEADPLRDTQHQFD